GYVGDMLRRDAHEDGALSFEPDAAHEDRFVCVLRKGNGWVQARMKHGHGTGSGGHGRGAVESVRLRERAGTTANAGTVTTRAMLAPMARRRESTCRCESLPTRTGITPAS